MPELPEVERAASLLRSLAVDKTIIDVVTVEDNLVFSGISNAEFEDEVRGRRVANVGRYGKVFYIELEGDGKMPVLHFGMTGMLQVKGQLATYYKETPRKASTDWPPRFMKFIFSIRGDDKDDVTELAFLDARRLGRIRLCASPLTEPPISTLGFDPILSIPSLQDFKAMVLKRTCPIKALLLDQSFSAGVGNWVADEILYHSRIHPEHRCNTLSDQDLANVHKYIREICQFAVSVNADDSKFPENWLFKHRWGKGKKEEGALLLPSGKPATIRWITVGGRTSAYVAELQQAPHQDRANQKDRGTKAKGKRKVKAKDGPMSDLSDVDDTSESELTPLEDSENEDQEHVAQRPARKRFITVATASKHFAIEQHSTSQRVTRRATTAAMAAIGGGDKGVGSKTRSSKRTAR